MVLACIKEADTQRERSRFVSCFVALPSCLCQCAAWLGPLQGPTVWCMPSRKEMLLLCSVVSPTAQPMVSGRGLLSSVKA